MKEFHANITYDKLAAATKEKICENGIDDNDPFCKGDEVKESYWRETVKSCVSDDESNLCTSMPDNIELEIILKDASPVIITFTLVPYC